MGNKVAYFNGIRLWENLKHWKPTPARSGSTRKTGTSRKRGRLMPHSPNFFYDIVVNTDVKPVTAVSDLGRQESFNLQMLQVQKTLIDASAEVGYLSWCQDSDEYVTVATATNPGSFPGAGTGTFTGAGFVPAVGQHVLLRNASTGVGFCTELTAAGAGTFGASFVSAVSAAWEMRLVRYYFPDTAFVTVGGWDTASQAEDRHAFNVAYYFESESHPIYKAGYVPTIS